KPTWPAGAVLVLSGPPLAARRATRRFPGRVLLVTLVELPLVLPPAVAGIGLFAAFGRSGLLGSTLDAFGLQIPFTLAAVVLAITFVASPLFVRTAIAAFEAVAPNLLAPSRPPRPSSPPRARSAPAGAARSSGSPCRLPAAASLPVRRSPSPAPSASSAPRSCSPGA